MCPKLSLGPTLETAAETAARQEPQDCAAGEGQRHYQGRSRGYSPFGRGNSGWYRESPGGRVRTWPVDHIDRLGIEIAGHLIRGAARLLLPRA